MVAASAVHRIDKELDNYHRLKVLYGDVSYGVCEEDNDEDDEDDDDDDGEASEKVSTKATVPNAPKGKEKLGVPQEKQKRQSSHNMVSSGSPNAIKSCPTGTISSI